MNNAIIEWGLGFDEKEARKRVDLINDKMQEIGQLLIELRDMEGWKALGYQSWTQFLESDELIYSRKRCLEFIRAFPVTVRLREELHITITTETALALASFPEEVQLLAVQTAINHKKPITANRVKDYATVYQEAVDTGGYVTTSDGQQRAISEAMVSQRRETEITRKQGEILIDRQVAVIQAVDTIWNTITICIDPDMIPETISEDMQVIVTLKAKQEA